MKYFTSDHHFGHTNIINYCSRPFKNVEEMHRALINNWNSVITPQDTVYVVGDFSFMNEERSKDLLSKLNGEKILIRGNHDRNKDKMLQMGFKEVYDQLTLNLGSQSVLLHHYPYRPKVVNPDYPLKKMNRRPIDKGHWLIHGHVHDCWQQMNKMINVSVEMWNYKPVSESEILSLIAAGPQKININTKKLVSSDPNY